MKTIFSRPDWNDTATHFGQYWTGELIKMCPTEVVELYKEQARRAPNEAAIKADPESFYYGFGHGNANIFTGQSLETVIDSNNIALWNKAWVHLLSCSVFASLGLKFPHGSGYNRTFYFYISTYPDGVAEMYFNSDHQVQLARWQIKTMGEQIKQAKDKFTEWYNKGLAGKDYLLWDRDSLIGTGNADDRPAPTKGVRQVDVSYQAENGAWTPIGTMTKGNNDLYGITWKVPAEGKYKLRYHAATYEDEEKVIDTDWFTVRYPESPIEIVPQFPKGGEEITAKSLNLQVKVTYVE